MASRSARTILAAAGAACLTVLTLAPASAGRIDQATNGATALFLSENPGASFYREVSGRISTVSGPAFSTGATAEESATLFVVRHAGVLDTVPQDLTLGSCMTESGPTQGVMFDEATGAYKFTLVYFSQERDGVPVFRADVRLLTRNEPGNPLVLVKSAARDLGAFHVPKQWGAKAISAAAMQDAVRRVSPRKVNFTMTRTVIWAGYDDLSPASPRLAQEIIADDGRDDKPDFERDLYLVDVMTGQVLFSENQVCSMDVSGVVQGSTTEGVNPDTCANESFAPMPYARVTDGTTVVFADALGNFVFPTASGATVTLTSPMLGQYFNVTDRQGSTESLTGTVTDGGTLTLTHNQLNTDARIRAEVNGYFSANRVRDYLLRFNPSYPTVAAQTGFPVFVNVSGSCNAFYSAGTINFYRAGGGCPNMAFGDVVHHEYGHHLVAMAGSGQGAYGEGMGDTCGLLISDNPGNGYGFSGNCAVPLRNAANSCTYNASACSSCGSEIHTCGQLISGCVWSTRNQMVVTEPTRYREILSRIVLNSMLLHTGTIINPAIAIDYVTLDDDDSDITNGSPHYREIQAGFAAHGMATQLTAAPIAIRFPSGRPEMVSTDGTTTVTFEVVPMSGTPTAGAASLFFDTGSGFASATLTPAGTNRYTATFPATTCGTVTRYYATATATNNTTVVAPRNAPTASYFATSAAGSTTVLSDDFSTDQGWVSGAPGDTASTTGLWTRGVPLQTYAQPGSDHSGLATGRCFFTGQGALGGSVAAADVDLGTVTLTSPMFDLSGAVNPKISYWRWFYNHRGTVVNAADTFVVQISGDNGNNWTTVETVGPSGPGTSGGWVRGEVNVQSFMAPTSTMKIRFRATDSGTDDMVEAAIDDVTVTAFACSTPCPADFNHDQTVSSQDFFDFLGAFFDANADFNHDGSTTSQDFFDFLGAFFIGC